MITDITSNNNDSNYDDDDDDNILNTIFIKAIYLTKNIRIGLD
jgi:hypothetical protein